MQTVYACIMQGLTCTANFACVQRPRETFLEQSEREVKRYFDPYAALWAEREMADARETYAVVREALGGEASAADFQSRAFVSQDPDKPGMVLELSKSVGFRGQRKKVFYTLPFADAAAAFASGSMVPTPLHLEPPAFSVPDSLRVIVPGTEMLL